ncbi:MAG TPA: acetylglutamate kinase [Candidatus Limnocylindria bacterium]|jgi:acetylglutamate kinase
MPNTPRSGAAAAAPKEPWRSGPPPHRDGAAVVLKFGGSVAGQDEAALTLVAALHDGGLPLVVVHGGGPLIGEWSARAGLESRFERGLRVTDPATRDVAIAVLAGLVNTSLVARLIARGVPAVGLSGVDGGLLRAEREAGLGEVGRITMVDSSLVDDLVAAGRLPVIAPAAIATDDGAVLNVNADSAAGALAAGLGARLLAFITDVPGVRGADGKVIPALDRERAKVLVDDGTIEGGMLPKVGACLIAAAAGCRAAIVAARDVDAIEALLAGGTAGTIFEPQPAGSR